MIGEYYYHLGLYKDILGMPLEMAEVSCLS